MSMPHEQRISRTLVSGNELDVRIYTGGDVNVTEVQDRGALRVRVLARYQHGMLSSMLVERCVKYGTQPVFSTTELLNYDIRVNSGKVSQTHDLDALQPWSVLEGFVEHAAEIIQSDAHMLGRADASMFYIASADALSVVGVRVPKAIATL